MRRRFGLQGLILLVFLLSNLSLSANNIRISNVKLAPDIAPARGWTTIQFTVSWENSWFVAGGPANFDAAWFFIKWKKSGSSADWKPVYLRNNPGIFTSNNNGASWGAIDVGNIRPENAGYDGSNNGANPGVGLFLHRSASETGTGNTPSITVRLRWYYTDDFNGSVIVPSGLTANDVTDIKVFGIEMVNVPAGPYYLGSGGGESFAFHTAPTPSVPYLVNNPGAINVGTTNGFLDFEPSDPVNGGSPSGNIPAAFPNGYNSFYCMKYEMSMQQFADFLNTIPSATAAGYAIPGTAGRYNLSYSGGTYATNVPFIAATYVKTDALLAFLDWSGLRPMTELEYEKACRGSAGAAAPNAAVPNEYAWGSAGDEVKLLALSNNNLANEASATPGANILVNSAGGGLQATARSGIFATPGATRVSSGSTYYGIMEMSGSVWERVISIGSAASLNFNGVHGDGNITTSPSTWPEGAPSYNGFGFRGSSWYQALPFARVSDRFLSCYIHPTNNEQSNNWGGRGVRSK